MDERLGQIIGNYRLTKLLGRGGFAAVYLGEHIHLEGYHAAIKIFSPFEETDEEETRRLKEAFRTEANRLAQLNHPNIVKVMDFDFIKNDTPYLIMENAPGGSLRSRYPRGSSLPPETISLYLKQVAAGLQHIHDKKLIHRDIKPANMLLGHNNTLLLSDIGIAVVAHREISYSPQKALGTPPYMAPEQWNENPCPASDQYSLGITLYEWLCGSRPFIGSKKEHENLPPPPLLKKFPYIKPEIEAVVFKALAKMPEDRYPTVQAFAEAFEQACHSPDPEIKVPTAPLKGSANNDEVPDDRFNAPLVLPNPLEPEIIPILTPKFRRGPKRIIDPPVVEPIPVASPVPNPVNKGNMQKRRVAQVGAMAAGALGASAFAANAKQVGGAPPGGGGRPRRSSFRLLVLLLVLLTLLLLAGIAFASPPGLQVLKNVLPVAATTAIVMITPVSQDVANTYAFTAVTGTPDTSRRQVRARIISVTSQSQSASAHTTGSIPGQQATGTLTFINTNTQSVTISGGILTGKSGVAISFGGFTVPPGSATALGTALNQGTSGNIPALDIATSCCASGILVRNFDAFSGGVDPQPNAIITQNDITSASNNLIKAVKPQAQSQLAGLVKSTEDVVPNSLSCNTSVSANHKAGDVAPTVTVTGTATCNEEVYDKAGALKLAPDLLTAQAAQNPGVGFAPAQNKIVTGVTGVTVIDSNQTVSLMVSADGIWVYQFTTQIKQQLANAIANKSKADALTSLKAQLGVKDVSLTTSNSSDTLPGASDITFNILGVNGPSVTPTPQNGQGGS